MLHAANFNLISLPEEIKSACESQVKWEACFCLPLSEIKNVLFKQLLNGESDTVIIVTGMCHASTECLTEYAARNKGGEV